METIKPSGVVQSTTQVELIKKIVSSLYTDLLLSIESGNPSSKARASLLLQELQIVMKEKEEDMKAWADVTTPYFYSKGMDKVVKKAIRAGLPIRSTNKFVKIHKQQLNVLITSGYSFMEQIIASADNTTKQLIDSSVQTAIIEQTAKATITGEARDKTIKNISNVLKSQGIKTVRGDGRTMNSTKFATMVGRTLLTKAQWDGTKQQMVIDGHDLVIVSDHLGECKLCRPWENEILSVNGMYPQYTRLDTAISKGLRHNYCRHVIDPYYEDFAKVSKVWSTQKKKYVSWEEAEPQNYERAVNVEAKDKLKAYDSFTSQIGLSVYKDINKALREKDTDKLEGIAKKQDNKKLKQSIRRLKKYV